MAEAGREHRRFVAGLALCTALPLGLVPALAAGSTATPELVGVALIVAYTGHIVATGWLGAVPDVRRQVRAQPLALVAIPLALIVGTPSLFSAGGRTVQLPVLAVFFAWQFLHFARQNLGLASIVCARFDEPGPTEGERRAIGIAGLSAALGVLLRPALLGSPFPGWPHAVAAPALALAVAGWAASVLWLLLRSRRMARSWSTTAVVVGAGAFFAPVFAAGSPVAALSGMAVAHGLQYLWIVRRRVIRSAAPDRAGRRQTVVRTAGIAATALVGGALLTSLVAHGGSHALYGVYFGVVMAHFAIDGVVWRRAGGPRRPAVALVPSGALGGA